MVFGQCILYFFFAVQGANVFRYRNAKPVSQKTIAEAFPGIPDDLDSAFTAEDGKLYFTKGKAPRCSVNLGTTRVSSSIIELFNIQWIETLGTFNFK